MAFDALIDAFTEYAQAAINWQPLTGSLDSRLLSSRGKMQLALRNREKPLAWWVIGMTNRMRLAAAMAAGGGLDASSRKTQIELILSNFVTSLVDLHLRRLLLDDFQIPAGLFMSETEGVDIDVEFPSRIANAVRPSPKGRPYWYRERFIMFFVRIRIRRWLGLEKK